MAQRAKKKHLSVLGKWKKWLQNKNKFSEENNLFEKGLNQFHKLFTTDKQYIQNIWKTVIVINEFSYLYFQVKTILKIPAEKVYGIISFDSYAIIYM